MGCQQPLDSHLKKPGMHRPVTGMPGLKNYKSIVFSTLKIGMYMELLVSWILDKNCWHSVVDLGKRLGAIAPSMQPQEMQKTPCIDIKCIKSH